jgi:signal transduction histidine kinase
MIKAFAPLKGTSLAGVSVSAGPIYDAARAGCPQVLAPGVQWYCSYLETEVVSTAVVPLTFEDDSLGTLWVASRREQAFGAADLAHLEHLSDQAVIAIQHAWMAAQLQSLAVIEERARIAREMHDGLAQILAYLGLETQTLELLARQGDRDLILSELEQVRRNISLAQADVRENILSLRTTLAGDAGLIPAVQEYCREFSVQTGIDVRFVNELGESPRLTPLAETQLVRIVQEALANVRKHSQAQQVQVSLAAQGACLQVSITDNGVGFDHRPARTHFGLHTMRERSESVGGTLTVTSTPGEGTQVMLWLPYARG